MVEIRYGEHYEATDLVGQSIAEAREQYKDEFGIPDKARARLNDKEVKPKLEAETRLNDEDELSFAEKGNRGFIMAGAVLLALAITGGIFAWGATTTTIDLVVDGTVGDFASVAAATSGQPTWSAFGSHKGRVGTGNLFEITPATGWTGNMNIILTITNAHDLVEAYRVLVLEIEIYDSASTPVKMGDTEYLTMAKGECEIDIDYSSDTPYMVQIVDGFYITHKGGWGSGKEDPSILCQVLQRSAP